ncbi:MAG: bifunctional DNA-binding transcriptional regulator/O6-methylguanine-DNA methyltransferase Ada [Alphaproteobacteria bacterium]|nr:bifunctional DNA-binding transcriptional regulator/O6-methylguanine-DNA methyltransferase Ada [Alphaproteobacteria bacterium]
MAHTELNDAPLVADAMLSDDDKWRVVAARDPRFDDRLVYAVTSTGIYCRPSCPSRRPKRANAVFFATPAAAARAGYRPCRRCRPEAEARDGRLELVRRALVAIEAGPETPPSLSALAHELGCSSSHLHRQFRRVVGVSPKRYGEILKRQRFKSALRAGDDIAGALYEAGYGSPSRVYEGRAAGLGMTPATYARGGRGAAIRFAIVDSPLDRLLVAATERGVCAVYLGADDADLAEELQAEFPEAERRRDDDALGAWVAAVLGQITGQVPHDALPLDVRASAFQMRVWQALQAIPAGAVRSYGDIADAIGSPGAARAVGGACAANPVSLVVPCHRAVRADGGLGGYRWGLERKQALIARERARAAAADGG